MLVISTQVAFLFIQWYIYGFSLAARYECQGFPCPHKIDCFLSRPTEKTIFIVFMLVVSVVSLVLNIIELLYISFKQMKDKMKASQNEFHSAGMLKPRPQDVSYIYCNGYPPPSAPMSTLAYNLDTADKANLCMNYNKQASEQNWTNFSTEQNQLGQRGNSSESRYHGQGFQSSECHSSKGCSELPASMGAGGKELHLLKQMDRPCSRTSSRARPDDLDI